MGQIGAPGRALPSLAIKSQAHFPREGIPMEPERLPRKLAAILYADVAGYSRLTGADEDATHRTLSEYLDLISTTIESHHGQVMHYAGDAVLAKFDATVDAVSGAVAIQNDLKTRNQDIPDKQKVQFRIGVNLGDVIEDRGDIYGDGVNVAARLEGLVDPGGICISESVRTAIGKKLPLDYEYMGQQAVKNIEEPVRTYRVLLDVATANQRRGARRATEPPSKPSIAVLPFENLSGDERWNRLADGISDDMITGLTRHPDLIVIARNSTFAYKGKSIDVRQIGLELNAAYVLEGSIQNDGERVRVTSQLIDASEGSHIWAERYDRSVDDLFAIQDDVVEQVAAAIGGFHGEILRAELGKARRRPPASLQAYELYLLGYELETRFDKENTLECINLLERVVRMDSQFSRAWTVLAWACEHAVTAGWTEDPASTAARRRTAILRAAELDPNDAIALEELGALRAQEGDISGARETLERALEVGRNHADMLALIAKYVATVLGREDEALALMRTAFRLNPNAPGWYFMNQMRVAYFARDFQAVIDAAKRATDYPHTHLFKALGLAQLGRNEEAASAIADFRARYPDFDPESLIHDLPLVHPPTIELYRDGLRKAGFSR